MPVRTVPVPLFLSSNAQDFIEDRYLAGNPEISGNS